MALGRLLSQTFDAQAFPAGLEISSAVEYLRCYLADLGAAAIIEEPSYFDSDRKGAEGADKLGKLPAVLALLRGRQ